MKKAIVSTICIICAGAILTGCGGVYSNYREVEQLLVIETMGFDYRPGGVEMSLASGISPGKGPVRLTGSGKTPSTAMDMARNYSFEDELFCSQTNSILIGERAAQEGIEGYLSYVCQSPILRTDVPVFIIRGGSAKEAILNTGDGEHGVSEILQGVTEYLEYRGASHIFKASDIVRSNLRHGSALCCVLEYTQSLEPPLGKPQGEGDEISSGGGQQSGDSQSGTGEGEPLPVESPSPSPTAAQGAEDGGQQDSAPDGSSDTGSAGSGSENARTLAVAGYAVLKDNRLVSYLDKTQAVGVGFLMNKVGINMVELPDGDGETVVLEISDGQSRLTPLYYKDGSLRRLDFAVEVFATVTEINSHANLSDEDYTRQLTAALESYVAERVEEVLRLSAKLKSDFLGLGGQLERYDAVLWHMLPGDFAESLPELEMSVSVKGRLSHANDMKESLT